MEKSWKKWLRKQPASVRTRIAEVAVERLMEMDEVRFRMDDTDLPENSEECLYWEGSGEDITKE